MARFVIVIDDDRVCSDAVAEMLWSWLVFIDRKMCSGTARALNLRVVTYSAVRVLRGMRQVM